MMPVNLNSNIAGYRLTEQIGSGGMGDVYRAYHPVLNREAAIKFLHQKDLAERFKNEAYIQSSVSHPNIAQLYEYTVSAGIPCIIMEYVDGESLDKYLRRKGKLTSRETENVVVQIASALAYLHQQDILHRDIKPQNFKIQPDGKIKMLDFGISKHKYTPKFTQQGFVVGTTEYMAPEQFEQKAEKKSDIWSLGVLTYELLTAYMPFESNNPISLRAKIGKASFTDPKILAPEISENLYTVIEKSLRVNPVARISAAEICTLLGGKKNQPEVVGIKIPEKKPTPVISLHAPKISLPKMDQASLRRFIVPAAIVIVIIVVSVLINNAGPKPPAPIPGGGSASGASDKTLPVARIKKIYVDVPGIENAQLVFPDGTIHTAPFEITGNEGDHIKFTVTADGYDDTTIEFDLNPVLPYTYGVFLNKKP